MISAIDETCRIRQVFLLYHDSTLESSHSTMQFCKGKIQRPCANRGISYNV